MVRVRTLLPYLLAFALGIGAAGLAACGSSGSSKALIPSSDAGPLKDDFNAIASAVDSGDCGAAGRALARAQNDLEQLPSSVSVRLRRRMQDGIDRLRQQAPDECQANRTQTETTAAPTTTETIPTTTETVPTTTQTTPTNTTPTTTTTTPPTTTTAPTTTSGGGAGAGGGGTGGTGGVTTP